MDTQADNMANINQPPMAGGMASRVTEKINPPGAPLINSLQKGSESFFQKSGAEILIPETNYLDPVGVTAVVLKKSDYSPEVGPAMYAYFNARDKYRMTIDTITWKNGEVSEKERMLPNTPPHFSEFARSIGVTHKRLQKWAKDHADFAEYYDACQDIIQEFYIDNGVTGAYSGQFSIFAAKNTTKMKDIHVNKNENYNMKDVLDAIEKGKDINSQNDNDF